MIYFLKRDFIYEVKNMDAVVSLTFPEEILLSLRETEDDFKES
jgi:hypothetical protein